MTRPVEYRHRYGTNAPAVRIFHGASRQARKVSKAINRRLTEMDTERNPFKNITAEAKSLSA